MRTSLILAIAVALALAAPAMAGTSAPGVNLRWDQCFGDGGIQYRDFACDTNSGFERLIGSFEVASAPAQPLSGFEVYMDVGSIGPLPSWWQLRNAGTCRPTSLAANPVQPPGAVSCLDWADGQAAGGIGAYNIGTHGPGTAYVQMAFAVPSYALVTLAPGQEYFAFALQINHAKTVGTGSCAGCNVPVVIYFSAMTLEFQTGPGIRLNQGANWSGSQWVSWQHGYPTNPVKGCGMFLNGGCAFPFTQFTVVPYEVTPTGRTTWGQVKSLYR